MHTKIFAVFALALVGVVGWYYFSQNQPIITPTLSTPNIHSQVSKIHAIQTHADTGEIEYQLTANALVQNAQGNDELQEVIMHWTPTAHDHYTIVAKVATLTKKTGDFVFGQGFILTHHANAMQPALVISGNTLTGNTKTKLISSQSPLNITQGDNQFTAKQLQADLKTGDYDFYDIHMQFAAPVRTDKPLF